MVFSCFTNKQNKTMYTYTFTNDDMTMAQLLTKTLLKHPEVTFAACKKRHPLEENIDLSFSVQPGKEELCILKECLLQLQEILQSMEKAF